MSIQGKNNLSYKKQNVQKQNAPSTGVKNITFAHIFNNVDEISIPFEALVTPPEWSTSGLVNPTSQSLLAAQLQVFKNNVTVTSSARGLIQKSEYIVFNNRIEFKNIASLANEVFEVEVADILKTGNLIVDMQTIRVEGELQDTETDFNIGYSFDVFDEEIVVFRDGLQMFRSDNNDSSGATGNYYYVDTDGDGKSSLIRFFDPSVGVEPVLVATTGGVVDSPNASTFQQIEHLAGQLDAVVPTVAALAGVPEDNFRAGPNNVDLKTFGDILININNKYDTTEKLSEYTKTKYQRKSASHNANSVVTGVTFNNLEINKVYRIIASAAINGSGAARYDMSWNQSDLITWNLVDANGQGPQYTYSKVFVADQTTLELTMSIIDTGAGVGFELILEELPNHEETTQWT